ncbi:MAG: MBL fold metallo-hydrolase, partial [Myxococcales bacterium]|nr:MBL fold metallo-hydrolase [Myxococcales bacterium]
MVTEIKTGRYTVRGRSLGGMYTGLHVPELDALFDAGTALRTGCSASRLFLSHAHVDHIGALPGLLGMRDLVGVRKPLTVHLPAPLADELPDALAAYSRMHRFPLQVELAPMRPGDELQIRRDLWVRAVRTFHPVPALGYVFFQRVPKLRPEFQDLPGPEIGRRRRAGEDLFDIVEHVELAYATDTLPRVLEASPELLDARVLILECTFLDDRKPYESVRAGAHVHLDDLRARG